MLLDGEHFSKGAFDFARRLNEVQPILLTGIFLPSVDYTEVMVYYLGGMAGPLYMPAAQMDPDAMQKNVQKFKELCVKNNIEHRVHTSIMGSIIDGVKKETRYADLLLVSSETFYSNLGRLSQEEYLNDTMHHAECPVIVLPEHYNFPQSAILAYDGGESSVFAIKQFAYLFPELAQLSTVVVYASDKDDKLPDMPYIEELAARHFNDLSFLKLDANAKKYFNTWLADRGSALLVTGSYGRSSLSEFFHKNFVAETISDHKLPIFIAHK